jgi:YqaJ-like viral recombinase domain
MNWPANFIDCEQGEGDWLQMRAGCVTSSRVADVVAVLKRKSGDKQKGQPTAARDKYLLEMVCERLLGKASDHYVSRWMEEGKGKEPEARGAYEHIKGVDCEQIGFVLHPRIKFAGASPDALIGRDGGAEFKCPKTETHLKYLMAGVVPEQYKPQMYWQIACCEWEWCDFASHDPSLIRAPKLKTFIAPRLYRDEQIIREYEAQVEQFNHEVEEMLLKLDPDYIYNTLKASVEQVNEQKDRDLVAAFNEDFVP